MVVIHNRTVGSLVKERYQLKDVEAIHTVLRQNGTFSFVSLPNGLFPAAAAPEEANYTGYRNVWVRDNIFVALAHYTNAATEVALRNIKALSQYFISHQWRLEKIIAGQLNPNEPMNRPHVRFDGANLAELDEKWAHAQNDALGYFVWLFCRIHREQRLETTADEKRLLALFVRYWDTICFWKDEDSGHWEETRKVAASSIGIVTRALQEMRGLLVDNLPTVDLDRLIENGLRSLHEILPAECVQKDEHKHRRYDSALLFLVFPMAVVEGRLADQIVDDVVQQLQGDYGIKRYLGDSFWAPNYKALLRPAERTVDVSDSIQTRDNLLIEGQEAQWCIFDPIISIIYGLKYKSDKREEHLAKQIFHFNRSLGQLTDENNQFGGFKCPELYYVENGKRVVNDAVPLLWSQANLWLAVKYLKDNLGQ